MIDLQLLSAIFLPLLSMALTYFVTSKLKISQFRKLVDSVDDAIKDNNVSEEEFNGVWRNFKALIN